MLRYRRLATSAMVFVVVVGVSRSSLTIVADRLELDAPVWANAHWWRFGQAGLAQNRFALERVGEFAGLTGYLGPVASLRVSGDAGALQPRDLCADLHWRSGLRLRVGQFLMPRGMGAMTDLDSQVLASISFLVSYTEPAGT